MADFRSPYVPELPRFTGGAVGYLGYDAAAWFEPVPMAATLDGPAAGADMAGFMIFDTVLAFDHVQHRLLIIANARITGDEDLESLYQFACAKIGFLEKELERTLSVSASPRGRRARGALQPDARAVRGARPRRQGAHRRGRHLPGGALAALRGGRRRRPVHRLPRAPAREPVALHVLRPHGRALDCRLVARDARARGRDDAPRRTRLPARARAAAATRRTCGSPRSSSATRRSAPST